jgi:hypothetical protein
MRRYPTSATILLTDGRKAGQVLISMWFIGSARLRTAMITTFSYGQDPSMEVYQHFVTRTHIRICMYSFCATITLYLHRGILKRTLHRSRDEDLFVVAEVAKTGITWHQFRRFDMGSRSLPATRRNSRQQQQARACAVDCVRVLCLLRFTQVRVHVPVIDELGWLYFLILPGIMDSLLIPPVGRFFDVLFSTWSILWNQWRGSLYYLSCF